MRVGILGSGLMGAKLGTIFARAGHEVVFSYARSQDKLKKLARGAGTKARAGIPREAAQDADALLLAVHWSRIDDVLEQLAICQGRKRRRGIQGCSAHCGKTGIVGYREISCQVWGRRCEEVLFHTRRCRSRRAARSVRRL